MVDLEGSANQFPPTCRSTEQRNQEEKAGRGTQFRLIGCSHTGDLSPPPLWPPSISAPHAILLEPGAEPRCCPLKVRKLKLLSHWGRGRSERNSSDWVGSSPPFSVQPGLFLPPRAKKVSTPSHPPPPGPFPTTSKALKERTVTHSPFPPKMATDQPGS